jgi:hypothetical protein
MTSHQEWRDSLGSEHRTVAPHLKWGSTLPAWSTEGLDTTWVLLWSSADCGALGSSLSWVQGLWEWQDSPVHKNTDVYDSEWSLLIFFPWVEVPPVPKMIPTEIWSSCLCDHTEHLCPTGFQPLPCCLHPLLSPYRSNVIVYLLICYFTSFWWRACTLVTSNELSSWYYFKPALYYYLFFSLLNLFLIFNWKKYIKMKIK